MMPFSDDYILETVSMKKNKWKSLDLSNYDAILHVAGLAHADVTKIDEVAQKNYYNVNAKLTRELAEKYKNSLNGKTGQFIYMSSIIIYGEETNISKKRVITKYTIPNPSNFYGDSKLQGENMILPLESTNFKVLIIRSPMVYGENSKGNYLLLEKIARFAFIFPKIDNERSMISVNNLCKKIKIYIETFDTGIKFPQDHSYHSTSEIVKNIRKDKNLRTIIVPGTEWFFKILGFFPGKIGKMINKAFGNLVYDKELE